MSSILRVAARFTAMVHPSEEALKKYLKDHPGADPKNHRVDKDRPEEGNEKYEDYEGEKARVSEADKKKVERLNSDLRQSVKPGSSLHKVLKSMGKGEKLPPRLLDKALKNMKSLSETDPSAEARKTLKDRYETFKRLTESYGK